jgi:hypothetical protein
MALDLTGYVSLGREAADKLVPVAYEFITSHPAIAGGIAVGAGGLVVAASPGVVVAPVLGAIHLVGFGTGGVVAGW